MALDQNPFVVSAVGDFLEGRYRPVPVQALLAGAAGSGLTLDQKHLATSTFTALWENLPLSGPVRETLLSVMHGIGIEPKHPAYRVSSTSMPQTFQSIVGQAALVFRQTDAGPVWLAILHLPQHT